jgi:hypothetical protein
MFHLGNVGRTNARRTENPMRKRRNPLDRDDVQAYRPLEDNMVDGILGTARMARLVITSTAVHSEVVVVEAEVRIRALPSFLSLHRACAVVHTVSLAGRLYNSSRSAPRRSNYSYPQGFNQQYGNVFGAKVPLVYDVDYLKYCILQQV